MAIRIHERVQDAVSVAVVLSDNRRLEAAVVERDPDTDIAVLKVEVGSLSPAQLGDSDTLQVGDWVLARGYPLGLSLTVTAGVVSGTGRSLGILGRDREAAAPIEHFIQTDAAINPGNSGGPLVDLAGRVVGVNSAIASPTGYYSGYGFAVPINLARRVADVSPGGPAAAAGIRLGDVIVALDSLPVRDAADLQTLVAQRRPGDTVRLRAIRYREPVVLSVTLGRFPSPARPAAPLARHDGPLALGFKAAETREGIVVSEVTRYSPAMRAGIRPGQRIVAVNRRPVRSASEFDAALRDLRPPVVISLRVIDPDLGETILNYEPEPFHPGR